MTHKILLGATKSKEVVFANFGVTTRNGYKEFTASFDLVSPRVITLEDIEMYYEDFAENFGKEYAYDMCERCDCKPSELARVLAEDSSVYDTFDLSLFPEEIEIDGETWYFESSSCGQCDTKGEMEFYVNEEVYNKLYDLWTNYHLKEVGEGVETEIEYILKEMENVDEMEWIENYIKENLI